MKVLICAMAYPPDILGGGEISTRLLAEGLVSQGIAASVLTFTDRSSTLEEVAGVSVHRIECPNTYWAFRSREQPRLQKISWHLSQAYGRRVHPRIQNAVSQTAPDIVHTSTIEDFGAKFWRWANQSGYAIAHTLRSHCLLHRSANMYDAKRDRFLEPDFLAGPRRRASRWVDGVVGISDDILQRHLRYQFFPRAITRVIGNSFEGIAADMRVQSDGAIRLGILGRIEPDKGIEPLVRTLRSCKPRNAWRLQIAGEGQLEYVRFLQGQCQGLPVEFVGWTDAREFLRHQDLLVIPSRCHEAFGRGVVEAYSIGVPVLCLRRGGLPELVLQHQTGWVQDEWSDANLATAIDNCRQLSSSRMIALAASYSVEQIAGQYIDFYSELLAKRNTRLQQSRTEPRRKSFERNSNAITAGT